MNDNTAIHPLARPNEKSGRIEFVHIDGNKHTFSTCVNDMSGSRLSWFDSNAPTVDESLG